MNILESESTGEGTPQGVVLALVGPENGSPKDQESVRSLRMYNLASLVSLAKYAVVQKASLTSVIFRTIRYVSTCSHLQPGSRPLDLRHPTSGKPTQQTSTPRKHRKGQSLAKGFKSLMVDAPPSGHNAIYQAARAEAYVQLPSAVDSPSSSSLALRESPVHDSLDSAWDMVEDLPLRWATDFVPLATTGSRLINTSVLSYALHRDENSRSRGGAFLAVVVKCNIFLYETPKGERAFRFVKVSSFCLYIVCTVRLTNVCIFCRNFIPQLRPGA